MTPQQMVASIAEDAGLEANDDGTYTVTHRGQTFLVEIKANDVTGA